jgi:hypothetical protein
MKPRALFIVTTDPRVSPRPAEAVRIAAGVSVWEKVDITLYLRGAATQALGEFADDLIDGENFTRYLPLLAETGRAVLVQRGGTAEGEWGGARIKFDEIDDVQLATHAAQSQFVLRF